MAFETAPGIGVVGFADGPPAFSLGVVGDVGRAAAVPAAPAVGLGVIGLVVVAVAGPTGVVTGVVIGTVAPAAPEGAAGGFASEPHAADRTDIAVSDEHKIVDKILFIPQLLECSNE